LLGSILNAINALIIYSPCVKLRQ